MIEKYRTERRVLSQASFLPASVLSRLLPQSANAPIVPEMLTLPGRAV